MGEMLMKLLLITVAVTILVDALGPIKLPLKKIRRSKLQSGVNPKFGKDYIPEHQSDISLKFDDDYFAVEIYLGTPEQRFELALDMVDRRTTVLRDSYSPLTHKQNTYDYEASTTANPIGWYNQSDNGFWFHAYNFSDVLQINEGSYSVPLQTFGAIKHSWNYSDHEIELINDGILGFGIPALKNNETTSASLNLLKQFNQTLYTVSISSIGDVSKETAGGVLTLGGYDIENCGANREKNLPLFDSKSWFYNWVFSIKQFKIRDYKMQKSRDSYVNVGQSTISLPTAEFNAAVKQIKAIYKDGFYVLPCDQDTGADIVFTINTNEYSVTNKNYIVDLGLGSNQCVLALEEGSGDNASLYGLGMPFFKNFCTIIDVVARKINFAPVINQQ